MDGWWVSESKKKLVKRAALHELSNFFLTFLEKCHWSLKCFEDVLIFFQLMIKNNVSHLLTDDDFYSKLKKNR